MKSFFIGLLVVLLLWYGIKAILRLFSIFMNPKTGNNFNNPKSNKGKITFDFSETTKKHSDSNKGEYIDFEEVK